MANAGSQLLRFSFKAGADLSAKEGYFVKLSADRTVVVCAATTDLPIGVLTNNPTSGHMAIVVAQGEVKVSCNAALSVGNVIGTHSTGEAAAYAYGTDTTKYMLGQVIGDANSAIHGKVTAVIDCVNPPRGT